MKIQVNKQNVGLRIKQIRLDKGYTLEEFGELFGASKSNVYRWEQGKVLPNKDRLQKIAKFSDKTVNELLYYNVEEFVRENYKTKKIRVGTSSDEPLEYDYTGINYILNYIEENDIKLDINNIDNLINFIDTKVALRIIAEEVAKLDDNDTITENRLNLAFIRVSDDLKIMWDILNNKSFFKTLSDDDISKYIRYIEVNIDNLEKIKEYLKKSN